MKHRTLSHKLLDILQEKKLIDKARIKKVLNIHKKEGGTIGKILVKENIITHKDLMGYLSAELDIPPPDLSKYKVDPNVAKLVPAKLSFQQLLGELPGLVSIKAVNSNFSQ